MKQAINLGAYGWRHQHWSGTFYPEDLPAGGDTDEGEDWRLTYYSNQFNTVMVPADYWFSRHQPSQAAADCESWLNEVDEDFRFYVECHVNMLERLSLPILLENLKHIQPQLSALVFIADTRSLSTAQRMQFLTLSDELDIDIYDNSCVSQLTSKHIWREDVPLTSSLAMIENDLADLRATRKIVEAFIASMPVAAARVDNRQVNEATIIVNHPLLQVADLTKLRSVLEIMGY